MIKNKFHLILLFLLILLLWFTLSSTLTSPGHFDDLLMEYEERHKDTSLYTPKCDEIEIMMVGVKYGRGGNQKKCRNWIKKRDFCISLHPEYKGRTFQDVSEICIKKEEK